MSELRHYSLADHFCLGFDQFLRAITHRSKTTGRPNPTNNIQESVMTAKERKHAAALMRINHTGEVCAQALYHSQGLVSRSHTIKTHMRLAAIEEGDHLAWCKQRVFELGSHTSYLNPLWYMGSFSIGLAAGLVGDAWSLGFLAETEQQVVNHLQKHITQLANVDQKSHALLTQMQQDEALHRDEAIKSGANSLPFVFQKLMQAMSKVMVKTTYWI